MVVLANRQLTTDNYISDLRKKLTEVESEQSALRDKLVVIEEKLKGSETALEQAWHRLEGEKVGATILQASPDELKSQWEVEKERASNEAVMAYMESKAFNDKTTKFYINGFKTLYHRALRTYPDLDLSMFKADAESTSIVLVPSKEADA